MAKLESPNQYGDKGNKGPSDASQGSGKVVSPNKSTASKEASGHDNGR
jgi:hypothetical protein